MAFPDAGGLVGYSDTTSTLTIRERPKPHGRPCAPRGDRGPGPPGQEGGKALRGLCKYTRPGPPPSQTPPPSGTCKLAAGHGSRVSLAQRCLEDPAGLHPLGAGLHGAQMPRLQVQSRRTELSRSSGHKLFRKEPLGLGRCLGWGSEPCPGADVRGTQDSGPLQQRGSLAPCIPCLAHPLPGGSRKPLPAASWPTSTWSPSCDPCKASGEAQEHRLPTLLPRLQPLTAGALTGWAHHGHGAHGLPHPQARTPSLQPPAAHPMPGSLRPCSPGPHEGHNLVPSGPCWLPPRPT